MRQAAVPQGMFKPKTTAIETKHEATNKVAREIIDNEAAARARKTERLRLARLARDATDVETVATPPKRAAGRKKA